MYTNSSAPHLTVHLGVIGQEGVQNFRNQGYDVGLNPDGSCYCRMAGYLPKNLTLQQEMDELAVGFSIQTTVAPCNYTMRIDSDALQVTVTGTVVSVWADDYSLAYVAFNEQLAAAATTLRLEDQARHELSRTMRELSNVMQNRR